MEVFDLKRFRKENNLTQVEVAELFSCKQNFISNIEAGIKQIPQDKLDILQSKYGDISEYISRKEDTVLQGVSPQELMMSGADAFSRQIVQMMNDKLIAPYGMIAEKEIEIERLNRLVGKLEAQLELAKKTVVQEGGNVTCANVG